MGTPKVLLVEELIFIATAHDDYFREDRENLTRLGYKNCARFSSGHSAVEFIKYNPAHVVLVDCDVHDFKLADFVAALREVRPTEFLHIIAISADRSKNFLLSLISAGCSGLVLRPYTLDILKRHMLLSEKLRSECTEEREAVTQASTMIGQGRYEEAIGDLSMMVSQTPDEASELFFRGCHYLVEKKWSEAIRAFNQSLACNQTFIKAYEGLAKAYLGKNDTERYTFYLQKAADEYARLNNFAKVKKIFVEIVKYDVNAPNPYNNLGIRLRQEKQYKESIQAYFQAIEISPKDENIHYNMAKAYLYDKQPEQALACIKHALALASEHIEALKLFRLLTGVSWDTDSQAPLSAHTAQDE